LKVPAGSEIVALGHFENSTKNKYNPAPEKKSSGPSRADEVYEPYIEYTVDSHNLQTAKPATSQQQQQPTLNASLPPLPGVLTIH
jgi:hypothetical protein